ncbi:unnamed protein product [Auanema sp. JU1783]|nr:unnamed protein product [Auanema sp. JU1783]
MTSGILYFIIVEIVGLGFPILIISGCLVFNVGNTAISNYAFMSLSFYHILASYYVLMSNTDYRNRVKGILKKVQELGTGHLSI